MTTDELFCAACNDLAQQAWSQNGYGALRAAGLLRLLLLDDDPLLHQVNRPANRRVRLMFEIAGRTSSALNRGVLLYAMADGLDPGTAPPAFGSRSVRLKQFLAETVMKTGAHRHSVLNLIHNFAYVNGLLHAGQPKSVAEADLASNRGLSASHTVLAAARVTLRALRPLYLQVCAEIGWEATEWLASKDRQIEAPVVFLVDDVTPTGTEGSVTIRTLPVRLDSGRRTVQALMALMCPPHTGTSEHLLECKLFGPEGKERASGEGRFRCSAGGGCIHLSVRLRNVEFVQAGIYWLECMIDGRYVGRYPHGHFPLSVGS